MADKKEEEYLDELLSSMSNSDQTASDEVEEDVKETTETPEEYPNEDDDMAVLSQMFLNENGISNDEKVEKAGTDTSNDIGIAPLTEDSDYTNDSSMNAPEDDYTNVIESENHESENQEDINHIVEPILSDTDSNQDKESVVHYDYEDNDSNESKESLDETEDKGFFDSLQDILGETSAGGDSDSENNNVESSSNVAEDNDILALDDSVPQENNEFTDYNNEEATTSEPDPEDNVETDSNYSTTETDTDFAETATDIKNKKKKDKTKKKFSIKDFFLKFDDSEDKTGNTEGNNTSLADENQQLMDELYKNEDSLDDIEVRDEKPDKVKIKKAKKEKKPKVKKPAKEKKVKPSYQRAQVIKIKPAGFFRLIIIVALIVCVVVFGGRILTYKTSISAAKKNFNDGNYTTAYEKISGMDIKSKDKQFYNKLNTIMKVQQGYDTYKMQIKNKQTIPALDALIKAVSRKNRNSEDIAKYDVSSEVESIYSVILSTLDKYGIDEEKALDLADMNNYKEYTDTLAEYGGITGDSNN